MSQPFDQAAREIIEVMGIGGSKRHIEKLNEILARMHATFEEEQAVTIHIPELEKLSEQIATLRAEIALLKHLIKVDRAKGK